MEVNFTDEDKAGIVERAVNQLVASLRPWGEQSWKNLVKSHVAELFMREFKGMVEEEVRKAFTEIDIGALVRKKLLDEPDPNDWRHRPLINRWVGEQGEKIAYDALHKELRDMGPHILKTLASAIAEGLTNNLVEAVAKAMREKKDV